MILDKRKNLQMSSDEFSFKSLLQDLHQEEGLSNLEKCVVMFQMLTYVGDDLYDDYDDDYPGNCNRKISEKFVKDNSSFVEY
jgi:hypothetical protein